MTVASAEEIRGTVNILGGGTAKGRGCYSAPGLTDSAF